MRCQLSSYSMILGAEVRSCASRLKASRLGDVYCYMYYHFRRLYSWRGDRNY